MDYSITDLMKAASMMSKKYFGKKDEYTISFTKEDDGCWYVDYPDWPFDDTYKNQGMCKHCL